MPNVLKIIFGSVVGAIGLNSLFGIINEPAYMLFIVGGIGAIIMFTPVIAGSKGPRGFFRVVQRYVFGAFLVLSAIGGFLTAALPGLSGVLGAMSYGSFGAGLAISFIGAIYFLSAWKKTSEYEVST